MIIRVALALDIDFVGPMILTALISNSAGMLTLVGDPATFVVGSAMNMTFAEFIRRVSLGGLLTVLVFVPLFPRLMRDSWKVQRALPADLAPPRLKEPVLGALALLLLAAMILLFLFGEELPTRIVPPGVSIIACAVALLIVYAVKVEPVQKVLADIDWKTLIFIISMFVLVQALIKAGFLQTAGDNLYYQFGVKQLAVAFTLLFGIGCLSSVLPNIPVVAAAVLMIKGYLVTAQLVPEEALGTGFDAWPITTLPVFVAMMFGGTLGGNATLIGASANIVSGGICAAHGRPVRFFTFMRYGVPVTLAQITIAAVYVLALYYLI